PFGAAQFSAAIGDGSFNALSYPGDHRRTYDQLSKVIRPGGMLAFRLFKTPDRGEPIAQVHASARSRKIASFHAYKWRLAMALVAASGDPNICVETIRDAFIQEFPDRPSLSALTGWPIADIDTIDGYKDCAEIYSFPTFEQLRLEIPETFVNA